MARTQLKERVALELPINHLEGCPESRVESFHSTRPARPEKGLSEQPITVSRCVDCGEQALKPGRLRAGDRRSTQANGKESDDGTIAQ